MFAENQDYGIHGERVRTACWGYLCQSGGMELREVTRKTKCLLHLVVLVLDYVFLMNTKIMFDLATFTCCRCFLNFHLIHYMHY